MKIELFIFRNFISYSVEQGKVVKALGYLSFRLEAKKTLLAWYIAAMVQPQTL